MKKRGGNTKESSILKEATYVLKCPSEGQSKQEVVDIFGGDERQVSLWIEFAKDSHLLDQYIRQIVGIRHRKVVDWKLLLGMWLSAV